MDTYLIIDCGTTNLRAVLTDMTGKVLAQASRPGGVRHTAVDGHNGRLKAMLKEAIDEVLSTAECSAKEVAQAVAYGMITSNVGLLEIPHLAAPAGKADLHNGMKRALFEDIAPFPIAFIPGVRNFGGAVDLGNYSDMDMMRGEEVESIGLYKLLQPEGESIFILPGSHNKFVKMDAQGNIAGCMTSISGELLDAVTHHTILADAVDREFADEKTYDAQMALKGAQECLKSGLGRAAFAGRILNQLGHVEKERLRSFLLGAVLAQDVLALQSFASDAGKTCFYIAGKDPLRTAIEDVMHAAGITNTMQVSAQLSSKMGLTGAMDIAGLL